MVFNLVTKPHSKHTNICYYGIHELVVKGKVELSFIDNAKKSHQSPHQEIHKVQSSIGLTVSLWQLLPRHLYALVLYMQHSEWEC